MTQLTANANSGLPQISDVIIVGAGISGINAAYRIQSEAPQGTTYLILETRNSIGGTWDLFRYPGIRSDSDIITFGFAWNPWDKAESMASGPDIKEYMIRSAQKFGIDEHILFQRSVVSAEWYREEQLWTLTVQESISGSDIVKRNIHKCRFLIMGTGYYDYTEPRKTTIPGLTDFKGTVVHPQFWPEDLDYKDKDVVIVGSGATAITLLPSMSHQARHVTMLQRSPTYVFSLPLRDNLTTSLRTWLPTSISRVLTRALWISRSCFTAFVCRRWPDYIRRKLKEATTKQLPPGISWDPHFNPRYNPWEQRLCASKGGDFYAALRSGKGSVVTDNITRVTENGIKLESGESLKADVIVTATGLKLKFAGGIKVAVDGEAVDFSDKWAWKSVMVQDVPNMVFITGYENASWTLGADVSIRHFIRLVRALERKHAKVAIPRLQEQEVSMKAGSLFNLSSTYLKSAGSIFPKTGSGYWNAKKNYIVDMWGASWGDATAGLEIIG
ncbi:hypothetical protein BKA67DRAFT_572659 [Truncatella angustata]|uniref:Flavin-containing monooxygenase n=1 Tax=Truncatella angustata TaxID=152316 RepID=A0A9P8ZUU4_9PEZI|nr:uncharacterized protein BKA67DRAFT_572659 [Truncatella angustata]KAH6652004.1 hypothetical protein BKA67DRAFT_572659 [Truncatella angustata]